MKKYIAYPAFREIRCSYFYSLSRRNGRYNTGKGIRWFGILGIKYDPRKNRLARTRNKEFDISHSDLPAKVLVIPTDEELVFVEDMIALIEGTYDIHINFRYSLQKKTI